MWDNSSYQTDHGFISWFADTSVGDFKIVKFECSEHELFSCPTNYPPRFVKIETQLPTSETWYQRWFMDLAASWMPRWLWKQLPKMQLDVPVELWSTLRTFVLQSNRSTLTLQQVLFHTNTLVSNHAELKLLMASFPYPQHKEFKNYVYRLALAAYTFELDELYTDQTVLDVEGNVFMKVLS